MTVGDLSRWQKMEGTYVRCRDQSGNGGAWHPLLVCCLSTGFSDVSSVSASYKQQATYVLFALIFASARLCVK